MILLCIERRKKPGKLVFKSLLFWTQMVLVLKKEVVKTNNVEHEDTGKYRQLLVRTLHQCCIKFQDIAATIIPVVCVTTHWKKILSVLIRNAFPITWLKS